MITSRSVGPKVHFRYAGTSSQSTHQGHRVNRSRSRRQNAKYSNLNKRSHVCIFLQVCSSSTLHSTVQTFDLDTDYIYWQAAKYIHHIHCTNLTQRQLVADDLQWWGRSSTTTALTTREDKCRTNLGRKSVWGRSERTHFPQTLSYPRLLLRWWGFPDQAGRPWWRSTGVCRWSRLLHSWCRSRTPADNRPP